MNWDAIGALSDLLGAVAVIVSVLYLAAQVRLGTADVRANIINALHSKEVDVSAMVATSTVLATAVDKAHTGGVLTDEERAAYTMFLYSAWVNFQAQFHEHERLGMESEHREAARIRLAGMFESPLSKAVWERLKNRYTPQFQRHVEDMCIARGMGA